MLNWHLKYGDEQWFHDIEEQEGILTPALDNKPTLYTDLHLDWRAFFILSNSRPIGFGLGYIQLSEIYAYMQMFDITGLEERRIFLNRIQILDSEYLKFQNAKENKDKSKAKVRNR